MALRVAASASPSSFNRNRACMKTSAVPGVGVFFLDRAGIFSGPLSSVSPPLTLSEEGSSDADNRSSCDRASNDGASGVDSLGSQRNPVE
jgi:hypothetical protein